MLVGAVLSTGAYQRSKEQALWTVVSEAARAVVVARTMVVRKEVECMVKVGSLRLWKDGDLKPEV
jgi:hypothetical protein